MTPDILKIASELPQNLRYVLLKFDDNGKWLYKDFNDDDKVATLKFYEYFYRLGQCGKFIDQPSFGNKPFLVEYGLVLRALIKVDMGLKILNPPTNLKQGSTIMTSRDFCYWLQGYFELSDDSTISADKAKMIKAHLAMVFKHEIDPSAGSAAHQAELNQLHKPSSANDLGLARC